MPHVSPLRHGIDLTADGLGNSYAYNADGMITASGGATYTYDGLNQRVEKAGGSNPSETIYFGGMAIALLNASTGAWTDLIYAGSSMIAEVAGTQTALPTYRQLDHLGSLAVQTNSSGTVTGSNVFLPFGDLLSSTTSDVFQYTGLPQDTENSSDHATYRNLSTTQSRWLSPDPYNGSYDITNPQSFNRYVYAMNNPLARPDPTGLDGDCGITCAGENGNGGVGGGGGGDPFGFGGGGVPDPCAGATVCVVGTPPTPPDPTTSQPPSSQPPSPTPPLVPVVFYPSPGPPGQPSSGGGTSTISSAPTSNKPLTPKQQQCVAQVQANAQNARFYIEAGAGGTVANTTAACVLAGPGAPECAVIVDVVELVNTGLILWGESNNESQEEAACRQ